MRESQPDTSVVNSCSILRQLFQSVLKPPADQLKPARSIQCNASNACCGLLDIRRTSYKLELKSVESINTCTHRALTTGSGEKKVVCVVLGFRCLCEIRKLPQYLQTSDELTR
jgi:hypothetical protein